MGATILGPGAVRHAGKGPSIIGFWSGGANDRAKALADLFNRAGIETQVVKEVKSAVWDNSNPGGEL